MIVIAGVLIGIAFGVRLYENLNKSDMDESKRAVAYSRGQVGTSSAGCCWPAAALGGGSGEE
mgnify:CR=1 FL=1